MDNFNRYVNSGGKSIYLFYHILILWKGSLYKLIWVDLICYLVIFYIINGIYRFVLNQHQKKTFVKLIQFADEMKESIPFYFILGFFVAGVIVRWFKVFLLIPWLQRPAIMFESCINGNEQKMSLRLRRNILRYLNLAWILQMLQISKQIESRFRKKNLYKSSKIKKKSVRDIFMDINDDQVIQNTYGKLIIDGEIKVFESLAAENADYIPEYWIPIQWASRLVRKAVTHNYFSDPGVGEDIIRELENIRSTMQELQMYSEIMIPLVYTQVVIISVYSFFMCELMSDQLISPSENVVGHEIDTYFPIFSVFEMLFLMGWLKVALCVMNPFGDDEEDFQTSNILDYNLESTFRMISIDSDMFPDKLSTPQMIYNSCMNCEPDNLEMFLDNIDDEIATVNSNILISSIMNFEIEPTFSKTNLNCTQCNRNKCFYNSKILN